MKIPFVPIHILCFIVPGQQLQTGHLKAPEGQHHVSAVCDSKGGEITASVPDRFLLIHVLYICL